jgi:hypothetical protein
MNQLAKTTRAWTYHHGRLPQLGLGAAPVYNHADNAWYALHNGQSVIRYGLGAPVDDAAQAMLSYTCSPGASTVVSNFQSAYNAANTAGTLAVDGKYGIATQTALQATLDAAGAGIAPAPCYDASGAYTGPGAGNTSTSTSTTTTSTSSSSSITSSPYLKPVLIGAAAIAVGLVGYELFSHRKGKHRAAHHRR